MLLSMLPLTGCYMWEVVQESEVGLKRSDGSRVDEVLGPGRYTNMDWFADLVQLDVSSKLAVWEDNDLITSDKQPIGVQISITYARKRDKDSVLMMWQQYRAEAQNDEILQQQVRNRIPSIAKTVTAAYSLDELLGTAPGDTDGRPVVTRRLTDLFKPELDQIGVTLLDIRFSNFSPDEAYLSLLKEKATVGLQQEISTRRTQQLVEQFNQEVAQTKVAVEVAERSNKVEAAKNLVYAESPQAFRLRELELTKDILGPRDKIYFVPQGTDITMWMTGEGGTTTVPAPRPAVPSRN